MTESNERAEVLTMTRGTFEDAISKAYDVGAARAAAPQAQPAPAVQGLTPDDMRRNVRDNMVAVIDKAMPPVCWSADVPVTIRAADLWCLRGLLTNPARSPEPAPISEERIREGYRGYDMAINAAGQTRWQVWRDACAWMLAEKGKPHD